MNNIIILNEKDNVAIALYDIKKGTCIIVNDKSIEIKELVNEIKKIILLNAGNKNKRLRDCALAILNTGSVTDDPAIISHLYNNFTITPIVTDCGLNIKLKLI